MKKETVLTLKSGQLTPLFELLFPLNLGGKELRAKVRFLRTLQPLVEDHDKIRKELLEKHAKRDDKGEMVQVEQEDGSKGVELENPEDFRKDFAELVNSEVKIDVTESNKEDIQTITKVLGDIKDIKAELQFLYDDVCSSFEKI